MCPEVFYFFHMKEFVLITMSEVVSLDLPH